MELGKHIKFKIPPYIHNALSGKGAEKQIAMYYTYMNHHLDLYNEALEEGDMAKVFFQEEKLREIRNILIELEYFKA
jgi:flagellin-specific chaperone FliS